MSGVPRVFGATQPRAECRAHTRPRTDQAYPVAGLLLLADNTPSIRNQRHLPPPRLEPSTWASISCGVHKQGGRIARSRASDDGSRAHPPPQLAQSRSIASLGRREDSGLLGRVGTIDPDCRLWGRGGRGTIGSPGASAVPGRRRAAAARARRRHPRAQPRGRLPGPWAAAGTRSSIRTRRRSNA